MTIVPDFTRAKEVTLEVGRAIEDAFDHHTWDGVKTEKAEKVRRALVDATKVIIDNVPPSADRISALRKLREAKFDCCSAISTDGRF